MCHTPQRGGKDDCNNTVEHKQEWRHDLHFRSIKIVTSYRNPDRDGHSHSEGQDKQDGCCNQLGNRPKANAAIQRGYTLHNIHFYACTRVKRWLNLVKTLRMNRTFTAFTGMYTCCSHVGDSITHLEIRPLTPMQTQSGLSQR